MTIVQIQSNGQIQLPPDLMQKIAFKTGDLIAISSVDEYIFIKKVENTSPSPSLMSWFGGGKGAYKSQAEVDIFIANERENWGK